MKNYDLISEYDIVMTWLAGSVRKKIISKKKFKITCVQISFLSLKAHHKHQLLLSDRCETVKEPSV